MAETIPSLDPFLKTADAPFHRNIETRGLMSSGFFLMYSSFVLDTKLFVNICFFQQFQVLFYVYNGPSDIYKN